MSTAFGIFFSVRLSRSASVSLACWRAGCPRSTCVPPRKGADLQAALAAIQSEFPNVTDFEREFPSLCFALATGVGKTRLMGAFIGYLHLAHGIDNFFVLAPNLSIYNKLITDFVSLGGRYTNTEVLAKKDAAIKWCDYATNHACGNGGKPWKYVLIPHDAISENMTLAGLASQFTAAL